jgi:hypothetical protein
MLDAAFLDSSPDVFIGSRPSGSSGGLASRPGPYVASTLGRILAFSWAALSVVAAIAGLFDFAQWLRGSRS